METVEHVVIAIAAVGLLLAAARGLAGPTKKDKKNDRDDKESTRWRVVRVDVARLHEAANGKKPALLQLPRGLELRRSEYEPSERHLVLEDKKGDERLKVTRGIWHRKRLQVAVDGHPLVSVCSLKGKVKTDFVHADDRCALQGDPEIREYELRRKQKLVAIVSREAALAEDFSENTFRVETLKSEKPLPLLGIVIGIEAALGMPRWE